MSKNFDATTQTQTRFPCRRIADAAEVMGSRVVGGLERLGKGRFMRLGVRVSKLAAELVISMIGLMTSLALLIASILHGLIWRVIRLGFRQVARS